MRNLFAMIAGGTFGAGLYVSGMTDTRKVQGWLDIFGDWDPTLAFVMAGGMIPMAIAWLLTRRRNPLLGGLFPPQPETRLGRSLVIGSTLFGAGWGLTGLCPGPSVASLSYGGLSGLAFLVAMGAGMLLAPLAKARLDAVPAAA